MSKIKLNVPIDFVEQCVETINEFGAVRRPSFIRYIETALDINEEVAQMVFEKMIERRDIYVVKYADTEIVKTDNKHQAIYKYLDMFDAFLALFEEASEEKEDKRTAFANRSSFPVDFTFYDTEGVVYKAFIYDAHLAQKLRVHDRKKDLRTNLATLVVFPVGTNLKKVEVPEIVGPYRHAVVRKSDEGNTVCQISDMQGED